MRRLSESLARKMEIYLCHSKTAEHQIYHNYVTMILWYCHRNRHKQNKDLGNTSARTGKLYN